MGVVDCAALREVVSTPRWLSLPESRLVVNPFFGEYRGHLGEQNDSENGVLSLDLAYYVGSRPVALPDFCVVQEKSDAGLPSSPRVVAGPRLSLSDATGWQARGVIASFRDAAAEVTPTGDFGAIVRTVTVDLDQTPCLLVQTPPGSPAFDMKVNGGADPVDILLKPTARLGAIAANVATATGWHGIHTFQVLLYALGKGRALALNRVQFFGFPNPPDSGAAVARTQIWMPHQIEDASGRVTVRRQRLPARLLCRTRPRSQSDSILSPQGIPRLFSRGRFRGRRVGMRRAIRCGSAGGALVSRSR